MLVVGVRATNCHCTRYDTLQNQSVCLQTLITVNGVRHSLGLLVYRHFTITLDTRFSYPPIDIYYSYTPIDTLKLLMFTNYICYPSIDTHYNYLSIDNHYNYLSIDTHYSYWCKDTPLSRYRHLSIDNQLSRNKHQTYNRLPVPSILNSLIVCYRSK